MEINGKRSRKQVKGNSNKDDFLKVDKTKATISKMLSEIKTIDTNRI